MIALTPEAARSRRNDPEQSGIGTPAVQRKEAWEAWKGSTAPPAVSPAEPSPKLRERNGAPVAGAGGCRGAALALAGSPGQPARGWSAWPVLGGRGLPRGEAGPVAADELEDRRRRPGLAGSGRDAFRVQPVGDLLEREARLPSPRAPKVEDALESLRLPRRRPEGLPALTVAVTGPDAVSSSSQLQDRDAAVELGDGAENLADQLPRRVRVAGCQLDALRVDHLHLERPEPVEDELSHDEITSEAIGPLHDDDADPVRLDPVEESGQPGPVCELRRARDAGVLKLVDELKVGAPGVPGDCLSLARKPIAFYLAEAGHAKVRNSFHVPEYRAQSSVCQCRFRRIVSDSEALPREVSGPGEAGR